MNSLDSESFNNHIGRYANELEARELLSEVRGDIHDNNNSDTQENNTMTEQPTTQPQAALLHDLATEASARQLWQQLETVGIEETDAIKGVRAARRNANQLKRDLNLRREQLRSEILDALGTGTTKQVTGLVGELSSTSNVIELLQGKDVADHLTRTEYTAVWGAAVQQREHLVTRWNDHGTAFTAIVHDKLAGDPRPANVLASQHAGLWTQLTTHGDAMTRLATLLNRIDGEEGRPDHHYARGLAHPAAANRHRGQANPSMMMPRVSDIHDPSVPIGGNLPGWEWLGTPEVGPIAKWLRLITATPRPGKVVELHIDPAEEAADQDAFNRMRHDWEGTDHQSVAHYALEWWTTQQA